MLLILCLTGCGENSRDTKETNSSSVYLELANDYIAKDDYEGAIDVLQKGVNSTNDEVLAEMLKEILLKQQENDVVKEGTVTEIEEEGKNEAVKEKGYPWIEISGKYVDDEGIKENINFAYDEITDTYSASWGISVLEDVTVNENVLNGMIDNAEITFTYDEEKGELLLEYFDFTTRESFSLNYGRIIEFTHEEAKSNIDYFIQEEFNQSNYYYNGETPSYEENKITIAPKNLYWEEGNLIAVCYIVNGYPYQVKDITVNSLSFSNNQGTFVSGSFGTLENCILNSHSYAEWTLTFSQNSVIIPNANLFEGIYWNGDISASKTVDMSKASGILASIGMTEEEFRNSCEILSSSTVYSSIFKRPSCKFAVDIGKEYYTSNTDHSIERKTEIWNMYKNGQENYTEESEWNELLKEKYYLDEDEWKVLESSNNLEEYLEYEVYGPKGISINNEKTKDLFKAMKEYPDNYKSKAYLLVEFSPWSILYDTTYICDYYGGIEIKVIDYRDNVKSPTVFDYTKYDMYVIFLNNYRTTDDDIGLEFALISLEKCVSVD